MTISFYQMNDNHVLPAPWCGFSGITKCLTYHISSLPLPTHFEPQLTCSLEKVGNLCFPTWSDTVTEQTSSQGPVTMLSGHLQGQTCSTFLHSYTEWFHRMPTGTACWHDKDSSITCFPLWGSQTQSCSICTQLLLRYDALGFPQLSKQFSSVAQSCLTLCNPMNRSTPGLPVHHQLPKLTQTHVHWVGDAIQPSHPLSSPSPPAFNLSQHQSQGLYKCHEVKMSS